MMTDKESKSISRFLSLILRHRPEKAGITLDAHGWAEVDALIDGMNNVRHMAVTFDDVKHVVATNDKQRFSFNDDCTKIRANQGHSVPVDVELKEAQPPPVLYHGTSADSLQSIEADGIITRNRLHVHLSGDVDTAFKVGKRHGRPTVLSIDTARMTEDGFVFYISANGVWLTKHVPAAYVRQLSQKDIARARSESS